MLRWKVEQSNITLECEQYLNNITKDFKYVRNINKVDKMLKDGVLWNLKRPTQDTLQQRSSATHNISLEKVGSYVTYWFAYLLVGLLVCS